MDGTVLAELVSRLAGIPTSPIRLGLGGLGTFGGRRHARVVWLGLREGAEAAASLALAVEAACSDSGLAGEPRPFRAHLTVARSRTRGGDTLPELTAAPETADWTADQFVLYESHLGRPAAVYEPVHEFPFGR
jgi:2'-5' RNA ligase